MRNNTIAVMQIEGSIIMTSNGSEAGAGTTDPRHLVSDRPMGQGMSREVVIDLKYHDFVDLRMTLHKFVPVGRWAIRKLFSNPQSDAPHS
jgi:hypothetical protein